MAQPVPSALSTPDEVLELQRAIVAKIAELRPGLQRQVRAGHFRPGSQEWARWQRLKMRAKAFVDEAPNWFTTSPQSDRGKTLLRDLGEWDEPAQVGQVFSYTLNDLKRLRAEVTQSALELGTAVARSTTLDDATREEFLSMRERVLIWLRDEPSWFRADSQYRAGLAVQKDILPWYARLKTAGAIGLPPAPSPAPSPLENVGPVLGKAASNLFAGLEGLGGIILLVVIAYSFSRK